MRKLALFIICIFGYLTHGKAQTGDSVENIAGQKIAIGELTQQSKCIVVLMNNNTCTGCVDNLCKLLEEKADTPRIKVLMIMRSGLSIAQKRSDLTKFSQKTPKLRGHVYFDIQQIEDTFPYSTAKDGLFKKLNIKNTPEVLVFQNGKMKRLRYKDLFADVFLKDKAAHIMLN